MKKVSAAKAAQLTRIAQHKANKKQHERILGIILKKIVMATRRCSGSIELQEYTGGCYTASFLLELREMGYSVHENKEERSVVVSWV